MKKIVSALLIVSLFSCSIEKRVHNRGYFIQWKSFKGKEKPIAVTEKEPEENLIVVDSEQIEIPKQEEQIIVEPLTNDEASIPSGNKKEEECDLIILKSGEEIKARVLEIGIEEIKYKRCDNPDGATIVIPKHKALLIEYPNGKREIIQHDNEYSEDKESVSVSKVKTQSLLSMIFGILALTLFGGIPFGITSIILSRKALKEIKRNPSAHSENTRKQAVAGLVCGIVAVSIIVAYAIVGLVIILA